MSDLKYNYLPPSGEVTRHMWTVVGDNGGVHIWAEPHREEFAEKWGERFYGGVEIHSKVNIHSYGDGKPDHEECWLLGGPCYHDGSSLFFSENIEPFIRHAGVPFGNNVHEYMNTYLHDWYQSHFGRNVA